MRTLLLDIETFPNEGRAWGFYEQNLLWPLTKHWEMCSFSAKWLDESAQATESLETQSEYELLTRVHTLLSEASIVVAHNGDNFDIRKLNTLMGIYGFVPPSLYRTVDTYKLCKRIFSFPTNKLDHVCQILGIGKKIRTGGFELWEDCLANDPKAWVRMRKYNAHDVVLLEGLYKFLIPWMGHQPKPVRISDIKLIQAL